MNTITTIYLIGLFIIYAMVEATVPGMGSNYVIWLLLVTGVSAGCILFGGFSWIFPAAIALYYLYLFTLGGGRFDWTDHKLYDWRFGLLCVAYTPMWFVTWLMIITDAIRAIVGSIKD